MNPLSTVDVAAIEEGIRVASLDQLRGYSQNNYAAEVRQMRTTEYVPMSQAAGYQVLREPVWNKGESSCPLCLV